jgi:hypothetical protein
MIHLVTRPHWILLDSRPEVLVYCAGIIFYCWFIDDAVIVQLSRDYLERYQLLQEAMNSMGEVGYRLEWTSEPRSTIQIGDDGRIATSESISKENEFVPLLSTATCSHEDTAASTSNGNSY